MNRHLTDRAIRLTCRELIATRTRVTGRELRRTLKERFDSVGNTERIFRIWREEVAAKEEEGRAPELPADTAELQRRLLTAEESARANLARAERAELRERAHQDRWAIEVDQLRQQVRNQPNYAAEIRKLHLDCLDTYPDGTHRIRLAAGKSRKERIVPIHPEAAAAIEEVVAIRRRQVDRAVFDPELGRPVRRCSCTTVASPARITSSHSRCDAFAPRSAW